MNILISDSWLREFIKTEATPKQIGEYLSLCSQSVEKISRVGNDWIYDIEITTNRPDCLSVYGIARELAAILPRFGIKAKLVEINNKKQAYDNAEKKLPLEVTIADSSLCPRFTAIIFDTAEIKPSPKHIQERLEMSGIRALNSVVDISNYLMLELGQPMHTFDYDKIVGAKMIMRESKEKEKITTLDGQTRSLPAGTIVIEDGSGRLIDLCGIMGGENSAVDENTKRVLLFVQTYDPARIRKTCQLLSFRTEAASRFEKGVDPEGVIPAITRATEMFKSNCRANIASKLFDIYPNPPKQKKVNLSLDMIGKIIGVEIPKDEVITILKSLGFSVENAGSSALSCIVPHWRYGDVSIPEDLIEEVARLFGYFRLPSNLPPGFNTEQENPRFPLEEKVKKALKFWGFSEVVSYSMIGKNFLEKINLDPQNYLKISNPLTDDLIYMRPSLVPSVLGVISQNLLHFQEVKVFEVANIYIPQGENHLPEEIRILLAIQTGSNFFELKGILENLLNDLGIDDFQFKKPARKQDIYSQGKSADILIHNKPAGSLGEIDAKIADRFDISKEVTVFEIELELLIRFSGNLKKYTPIPAFPPIIEDLSFVFPREAETEGILMAIRGVDKLIAGVTPLDNFENSRTFRITYQSPEKTLSREDIVEIRKNIISVLRNKFSANLKS